MDASDAVNRLAESRQEGTKTGSTLRQQPDVELDIASRSGGGANWAAEKLKDFRSTQKDEERDRNARIATGTSAERESKITNLSEQMGMPRDVVSRNYEALNTEEDIRKQRESLQGLPVTEGILTDLDKYLNQQDDITNLGQFERIFKDTSAQWGAGWNQVDMGYAQWQYMREGDYPGYQSNMDELRAQQKPRDPGLNFFGEWPGDIAQMLPMMGMSMINAWDETLIGAGVGASTGAAIGSGVPGIGTGAGALTGARIGAQYGFHTGRVLENIKMMSGLAFDEYSQMQDEDGNMMDEDSARTAAVIVGAFSGAAEAVGMSAILATIPGGKKLAGSFTREAMRKALKIPANRSALAAFGKSVGLTALIEGTTEGLQEAALLVGQFSLDAATEAEFQTPTFAESVERITEAAIVGAKVGGALAAPGSAYSSQKLRQESKKADQRAEMFNELSGLATENKTRERMPGALSDHIQSIIDEHGGVDSVQVEPDAMNRFFQESDLTPDQVKQYMPETWASMQEAQATGAYVQIPLSEFTEFVAPSQNFNSLYGDMKFHPDEMTSNEIDARQKEIIQARAEWEQLGRADIDIDPSAIVYTDMVNQLQDAGYTPETAAPQALMLQRGIASLAERAGTDVETFYNAFKLNVESQVLEQARGKPKFDRLTTMLDSLRTGKIPSEAEGRGQSFIKALIARGGIRDEGGELAARDVQEEYFTRRAVKDTGMSFESAYELGVEEGFLESGRVPEQALLEAIDREIAGDPVYAAGREDMQIIDLTAEMQRMQDVLDERGVNLAELDNREAMEALGIDRIFQESEITDDTRADRPGIQDESTERAADRGREDRIPGEALAEFDRAKRGERATFTHRAAGRFDQFDDSRIGVNTETPSAYFGHYLSAEDVGNPKYGDTVMDVTFQLEKPLVITAANFENTTAKMTPEEVTARRSAWIKEGYDGILIEGMNWAVVFEGDKLEIVAEGAIDTEADDFLRSFVDDGGDRLFQADQKIPDRFEIIGMLRERDGGSREQLIDGAVGLSEQNGDLYLPGDLPPVMTPDVVAEIGEIKLVHSANPEKMALVWAIDGGVYRVLRGKAKLLSEDLADNSEFSAADGITLNILSSVYRDIRNTDPAQVEAQRVRGARVAETRRRQDRLADIPKMPDDFDTALASLAEWSESYEEFSAALNPSMFDLSDRNLTRLSRAAMALDKDAYETAGDGDVTIYRGMPEGEEFGAGDWVSMDEEYARSHEGNVDGGAVTESITVDGSEVYFPGADVHEWVYIPDGTWSVDSLKELWDELTGGEKPDVYPSVEGERLFQDEPVPDLYVGHNLSSENLRHAAELGGLAAPSLAVASTEKGEFGSFGEITLLADPGVLESAKVRTFDADVYTPRHPRATYDVDSKKYNEFAGRLESTAQEAGGLPIPSRGDLDSEGIEPLLRSEAVQYDFLKQEGKAPPLKKRKKDPWMTKALKLPEMSSFQLREDPKFLKIVKADLEKQLADIASKVDGKDTDRIRDMWLDADGNPTLSKLQDYMYKLNNYREAGGVDTAAMRQAIGKKSRQKKIAADFEAYVVELFNDMNKSKKLFKGFTDAGDRKYSDYTLANVVREMTQEVQGGEGFNYGAGSVRAGHAKEYKNIAQIQADRDRLVTEEEFQTWKDESNTKLEEALDALKPHYKFDADGWGYADDASSAIAEGPKVFAEVFNVNPESQKIADDLIEYLASMPTQYFEAKVGRAMDLSEFGMAVVPKGTDKATLKILKDKGIKVKKYDPDVEGSRLETIRDQARLFQDSGKTTRGFIDIDRDRNIFKVTLTGKANLSTFLHESGHFYLEMIQQAALMEGADPSLQQDVEILRDWMGLKAGQEIKVDQHEQFARGFEAYLMEGRAPTAELQGAFDRFKTWLMAIYKSVKALNVELTDDVRGVMDRILASDEAIERQGDTVSPLFDSAEDAGMTEVQYGAYEKRYRDALQSSKDQVEREAIRDLKQQELKQYRARKAELETEITDQINREPVYAVQRFIRQRRADAIYDVPEMLVGKRFSSDDVYMMFPNREQVARRLSGLVAKEGGVHPDNFAGVFNFDSGLAMIEQIANSESRADAVRNRTQVRLDEEFGDIFRDGQMEEVALDKLHNNRIGSFILAEAKAIGKRSGRDIKDSASDAAKAAATTAIRAKRVATLVPNNYNQAEKKYGRLAREAVASGNMEAATQLKLKQLLNFHMFREAKRTIEESEKIRRRMSRYNKKSVRMKIGKAGREYLDTIDTYLDGVQFRAEPLGVTRTDIAAFIAKQEADGENVMIESKFRSTEGLKNYKTFTIADLEGLRDAVEQVAKLAELKSEIMVGNEKLEVKDVVARLDRSISKNNKLAKKKEDFKETYWDKTVDNYENALASLTKMEMMIQWVDGEATGFGYEVLFKPLADAQHARNDLLKEKNQQITELFNRWDKADKKRLDADTTIMGRTIKRRDLLAVVLNLGNDGNRKKLLEGYGWQDNYGLVLHQLQENLTRKDFEIVQGIWDTIESLWPETEKVYQRTHGISPPKIEAVPLHLPAHNLVLKGGYYPVVYDRKLDFRSEETAQMKESFFGGNFIAPGVKKGFTEERTGYIGPINLNLDTIYNHIMETSLFITHYEAVKSIDRITRQDDFKRSYIDHFGQSHYKRIRPWLQNISNDGRTTTESDMIQKFAKKARIGMSVVSMGGNVGTMLMQAMGLFTSVDGIGLKATANGFTTLVKNPGYWWKFADEKSGEMRYMRKTMDRELAESFMKQESGLEAGTMAKIREFAFTHIALMQKTVNLVTWVGAYNDYQAQGKSDAQSVDYADSSVRLTQSAAGVKDLAQIQTGSDVVKLFTAFYTYFSVMFNRQRDIQRQFSDLGGVASPTAYATWLYRNMWMVFLPVIADALLRGELPDEDDDENLAAWFALKSLEYSTLGIPILRDVVGGATSEFEANPAPALQLVAKSANVLKNAGVVATTDEEWTENDTRAALNAGGLAMAMPTNALWKAYEWLESDDLEEPVREAIFGVKRD